MQIIDDREPAPRRPRRFAAVVDVRVRRLLGDSARLPFACRCFGRMSASSGSSEGGYLLLVHRGLRQTVVVGVDDAEAAAPFGVQLGGPK